MKGTLTKLSDTRWVYRRGKTTHMIQARGPADANGWVTYDVDDGGRVERYDARDVHDVVDTIDSGGVVAPVVAQTAAPPPAPCAGPPIQPVVGGPLTDLSTVWAVAYWIGATRLPLAGASVVARGLAIHSPLHTNTYGDALVRLDDMLVAVQYDLLQCAPTPCPDYVVACVDIDPFNKYTGSTWMFVDQFVLMRCMPKLPWASHFILPTAQYAVGNMGNIGGKTP